MGLASVTLREAISPESAVELDGTPGLPPVGGKGTSKGPMEIDIDWPSVPATGQTLILGFIMIYGRILERGSSFFSLFRMSTSMSSGRAAGISSPRKRESF